jgi:hypothetical protein
MYIYLYLWADDTSVASTVRGFCPPLFVVYTPVYRTSVHEIYLLNASGGLMLFSRRLWLGDFDLPYLSGTSHRTGLYWVKFPLLRSVVIRSVGHQL